MRLTEREPLRPTIAWIDQHAFQGNLDWLAAQVAPTRLCVALKANAYGHGVDLLAQPAVEHAAVSMVAAATPEEAIHLRSMLPDARILVLSQPGVLALRALQLHRVECVIDRVREPSEHLDDAAPPLRAHLKVNTGMNRAGCSPGEVEVVLGSWPSVDFVGIMTHFACADSTDRSITELQISRFRALPIDHAAYECHVANSAAALEYPDARFDCVRIGIAAYGLSPFGSTRAIPEIRPVMRLVSAVQRLTSVPAGGGVSYGHHSVVNESTLVATVPVGYGDGWRRDSGLCGVEVLVGGQRCPILGVVTMDQMMVAVPAGTQVGSEVVLIGTQGNHRISAEEIAERLHTINYEVTTSLSERIPRLVMEGA